MRILALSLSGSLACGSAWKLLLFGSMKIDCILLVLLSIEAAVLIVVSPRLPSEEVVVLPAVEVLQPLEKPVLPAAPFVAVPPQTIETSVAAVEVKRLVQPLEERDDSMLFESEELFGMPFDLAITMPFD